jgi:hypothetical protein
MSERGQEKANVSETEERFGQDAADTAEMGLDRQNV